MNIGPDAQTFAIRVEAMGADGDGIARLEDGRTLFLPFTLPGEVVEARPVSRRGGGIAGIAETILEPSPERAEPPCPHFGTCGGCSLQHWHADSIAAWKTEALRHGLVQAGVGAPDLAAIETSAPFSRRRVDFAIRKQAGIAIIGFHQLRADAIVPIETCLVAAPEIVALLAPLRALVPKLQAVKRDADCAINLLDTGPDLLLRTDGELAPSDRRLLAAFAADHGIPRIAWALKDGLVEIAAQLGPIAIRFAGAAVPVAPGAFLQATASGAEAITRAVLAGLPAKLKPRDRIIELHAGSGTLTFPLAGRARVVAYEGDGDAVIALQKGAASAELHGRIMAHKRDLVRQPLMVADFKDAAAVVLDPPFGGAQGQMEAIAASEVTHVIYVSCNPQALGRDAAPLLRAGFTLVAATPIDQFLWSARLEAVAVFTRPAPPRKRARPPR